MSKSFEIKGYINNVLKEIGLEGADAFDKALLLNALGKLEAAEHSDEYKCIIAGELEKLIHDNTISMGENDLVNFMYGNACYSVGKNETAVNIANRLRHSQEMKQDILLIIQELSVYAQHLRR